MEISAPSSAEEAPAVTDAMALIFLVGKFLICSEVTVPPCVVLSCSIKGTL